MEDERFDVFTPATINYEVLAWQREFVYEALKEVDRDKQHIKYRTLSGLIAMLDGIQDRRLIVYYCGPAENSCYY